jgi:Icc-related predicted phosphoesterase
MPNRSFGIRAIEDAFQPVWLQQNAKKLRDWIGARPFVFCSGNHDYVDPVPYLRDVGVDAYCINDRHLELGGVRFYGFPWTSRFYDWNWMANTAERRMRLEPAVDLMNRGEVDVFVAHGPMFGVLDRNAKGERCGSRVMRETMQTVAVPPRMFLHGHIHESQGVQAWSRGMTVSNAATTQRVLEV